VTPDGKSAYVANLLDDTVSQYSIDPSSGALSPKSPATVASPSPSQLAVTPDGKSAYVSNVLSLHAPGSISQYSIDSATGRLSPKTPARAAAGEIPATLAVTPDGKSLYAANAGDDTVSQYSIDPSSGALSPKSPASVPAGAVPDAVAVTPDGRSAYATNAGADTVSQYNVDPLSGRLSPKSPASVASGIGPSPDIAVSPDGESAYVTNPGGSNVSQYNVDPSSGALSPKSPAEVATGHAPFGIAVRPEPTNPTITGGPIGITNDPTPTFSFSSSIAGSTFQCRLDAGAYSACNSPKTTAHLSDGPHTFHVRAKNSHGNVEPNPASRAFTVRTASVEVSGSALVVSAAPWAKDNLQITRPSASILRVTDFPAGPYTGSGIHTGPGCTRSGDYTANCPASGITPALPVLVTSTGQDDKVVNSSGLPSSLYGGSEDDLLIGGPARDLLNGGPGADVMKGMNGNDLLLAHDGASDKGIDCGVGSDKADLDKLPKDPASVVLGCETKTRH
jgi:DNA-binding beta-propeller fold protein YncE